MAYSNSNFATYQPQHHSEVDHDQSHYIVDDEAAPLDPTEILDADLMPSPASNFRKESFAASNSVMSPATPQAWEQTFMPSLPVDPNQPGPHMAYHDDRSHYGPQVSNAPSTSFVQPSQPQPWHFGSSSSHGTPVMAADLMQPPTLRHDSLVMPPQRLDGGRGSFGSSVGPHQQPPSYYVGSHVDPHYMHAARMQMPPSPHDHQDWMAMPQREMDGLPQAKRMRYSSPLHVGDFRFRSDDGGIRKKNGRIDIPEERNSSNIDQLINDAPDEESRKELKQQKRLLRNREAALLSRQRKKNHTEVLEVQTRKDKQSIHLLETQVEQLKVENSMQEKKLRATFEQLQETMRMLEIKDEEKRELLVRHSEETASLRKRNQHLRDVYEAPHMSAAPSSNGFSEFNANLESLHMGAHEWENLISMNELTGEPSADLLVFEQPQDVVKASSSLQKKSSAATVTPAAAGKPSEEPPAEQPVASGMLFMLLLCGAFVASQPPDSSLASSLPLMPPAVRAVAPTVLSNLLSEQSTAATDAAAAAYQSQSVDGTEHDSLPRPFPPPTHLDQMHQRILSPSRQQEFDSSFGMTTGEYASVAGMGSSSGFSAAGPALSPEMSRHPKRNLAEALANMEKEHTRTHKSELYTRSLLWDQIPAEVVQQFRDLVRDARELDARQQVDFKLEM